MALQAIGAATITNYLNCSAPVSGTPFTMVAYAKWNTLTEDATVTILADSASFNDYFFTGLEGAIAGDPLQVQVYVSSGGGSSGVNSTSAYSSSDWNHSTGVFTSSTSRTVYLNAGNSATNTQSRSPAAMTIMRFLQPRAGTTATMQGAEFALWNAALTQDEITSLSKGFKPTRIRPQSLAFYAPCIRESIDLRGGLTITRNGTITVADHPRVY